MVNNNRPKPVVLCILDGWGHSDDPASNAIHMARIPNFQRFLKENPYSLLGTSGLDVGLPKGQMGNSEVGHMTIGSGRVVMQELPKIDIAIENNSLAENKTIRTLIDKLKQTKGDCHLLGLLSDGGVHAHIDHIIALAKIISKEGIKVNIHAITDGRDTSPTSAKDYLRKLEREISGNPLIKISTVMGRYYAMDRDKRWERVELAYNAVIEGGGKNYNFALPVVDESYMEKKNDEFIIPVTVGDYKGAKDGDAVLMANFRADRARQILEAMLDNKFSGFKRNKVVRFSYAVGMVEYSENLSKFVSTVFPSEKLTNILPEVISRTGLKQLRIAETEKYAHVTFFFSGGMEKEFDGEKRILIPSPKVATYDMQPEMSAPEVTRRLVESINSGEFDFIVVNYANTDMVGHTGDLKAAISAVEQVDRSLGEIESAVKKKGGVMMITADHGNAEQMVDPETKGPHTSHTLNPVPFILIGANSPVKLKNGKLSDIAPTILTLMHLPKPKEMNGESLILQ